MNRQELLEYLRTVSLLDDDRWNFIRYQCNQYCIFITFDNDDLGRSDYFFTELIKRVWEKIYGNRDVESERIGINLLKFLCGIGAETCFSMYGNTSALDNATVYTEGMLDIIVERDKEFDYIGKFIVDCDLNAGDYNIISNWCINCNYTEYTKVLPNKKDFYLVKCYNCTNSFSTFNCINCNDCIGCKDSKNCIDCRGCNFNDNCIKCSDLNSCNNCNNCKSCSNCNDMTDCSSCNYCDNCINCKHMKDCKDCNNCTTCHESNNISACSHCDKCSNCESCMNCANCDNCSGCNDSSYCSNSKVCQNCNNCSGCVNNVECKNNTDCTNCIKCENCKNCTTCEECKRCVDCSTCKKCSGCKNCSNCCICINQKSKKDISGKFFNRREVDVPKEKVIFKYPISVDLSVNGDRIDMDSTYIQYYDSDDNLLFQGICQYTHPCVYHKNCMNFAIGQGWFYYADTHQPRCYVNLSTKSKYSITVQDITDFCKNDYNIEDFITFIQERTNKMKNSFVSIYDRSGKFDYSEDTIKM